MTACGELPRPFEGRPGANAQRLALPPPPRLAIPAPLRAMLPDEASQAYAEAITNALLDREVPAIAEPVRRGDWSLSITAELRGDKVVPKFSVLDPKGAAQGSVEGQPVDAAQWSVGAPQTLKQSAAAATPAIATLLAGIEAAREQSDPNSLYNRPARVLVRDVTGAPGDGNRQLTRQLRLQLPKLGELVQDTPDGADFVVAGAVQTALDPKGASERVEVQWVISDARGRELGRVVQLNDVAAGTLDGPWGDVALVVTQEAAGGIRDVILKQTGARAGAAAKPGT